jgi:hypothetical protein
MAVDEATRFNASIATREPVNSTLIIVRAVDGNRSLTS